MGIAGIDWLVLCATLAFIVIYGVMKTRGSNTMTSYIKGGKDSNWWTIGLSVMATQASAITFMSTPGQAYHDGMGFVQFYFGLPLAMIVICMVFIPIYHKLNVYTAYEFLENRFDVKTRTLTSSLFLIQRGLAAGITIYAPAIILSTILGWNLKLLCFIIGIIVIIYTVIGGTKAVSVTQKQQMYVIFGGMVFAFFTILKLLPEGIDFMDALQIAGDSDKLDIVDFSFDPSSRYTFWSGITGGLFLALSYFGTDQSQVQRYLTGKSVEESRKGMIMNGLVKVPMQFFILLVGVMVFVFFQFNKSPVFFNEASTVDLQQTEAFQEITNEYDQLFEDKQNYIIGQTDQGTFDNLSQYNSREKKLREEVKSLMIEEDKDAQTNDKDYVFIYFILNYLPQGLIGLLLAVIFSAAMSSTSSELNALAATTTIDIYRRLFKMDGDDLHYVKSTKLFTIMWGCIAIAFACFGTLFENLIQFVNIIGSIFYGTILGVFLCAFFFKKIRGNAVFIAAIITEIIIISIWWMDAVSFLWLNVIGALLVIFIAYIIETINPQEKLEDGFIDSSVLE